MKKTFRFFTLAVSLLACLSAFGQEMNGQWPSYLPFCGS